MTRFRTLSPLAALLAAASFSIPAAAAPATGPDRYFTGSDLFNLEVATDPQISPDGRTIAYVRKSNDIMTDKARPTIWLVDVASGQQRPLEAGSGSYSSPRWSPDGTRLAFVARRQWRAAAVRPLDGERRPDARITGLPDSPDTIAWSPDGRRIAYSMFVPDEGMTPRLRPAQARRRQMGRPARNHQRGHLPLRRRRLFQARLHPDLLGAGGRRRADPADLRRDQRRRRQIAWTPDSRSVLFSADLNEGLGARAERERNLPRRHQRRRAGRAHQPQRPRRLSRRVARRPP